ncbi:hypothetical protein VPDG_00088 [Vibrio phage henriette 12B8]|uniref:hypothetical protein n=1 Tax=Vibrio phage henriette 12B8 TaxID=573174 RepID=UPI0002C1048B|nr:hypothetical protein VPDG_00088 [Vibrio phage henriette 12B8]AGG58249.1 hypothetical protein VPDG_00088 [Vibrio phage henriette 12B8]
MKDLAKLGLFEDKEYVVTRVPYGHHEYVGMFFKFDPIEFEFVSQEPTPRYLPMYKVIMGGFSLELACDLPHTKLNKYKAMAIIEAKESANIDDNKNKETK